MQTDNNLINLVGQPLVTKKKRNRTKNRLAYMRIQNQLQQQADNVKGSAANVVPGASTGAVSQGASQSGASSTTSQEPKQANTPGGAGANQAPIIKSQLTNLVAAGTSQPQKPGVKVAKPATTAAKPKAPPPTIQKKRKHSWLIPQKLLQWRQFQENIQWNFEGAPMNQDSTKPKLSFSLNSKGKNNITKPGDNKNKPQGSATNTANIASSTENKNTKSEAKMPEIKWELNKVDDLDVSTEDSPTKSQTPQLIQGFASEIKLTVKDQKKLVPAKESSHGNTTAKPVEVKQQKLPGGHSYEYNNKKDKRQDPMSRIEPPEMFLNRHMPAGVPKTFLMQQNTFGAIQPQQNPTNNFSTHPQQTLPAIQTPTGTYQNYAHSTSGSADTAQQYSPTEMYDPASVDNDNKKDKRQDPMSRIEPPEMFLNRHMPAGVPKTFLMQQNTFGAIQPQQNPTNNFSTHPQQTLPAIQTPTGTYQNYAHSTSGSADTAQQYSPTEMYDPASVDNEEAEDAGGDSPELLPGGQKRLSAFHRLGPVSQPKKPKLTINLLCNKDVREVVDDTKKEHVHTPVHMRQDVLKSTDETVMKYLPWWPWKKNVPFKKSVSARSSKSVMILEQEQMEEAYEKDNVFFQVFVRDFPPHWKKEQVLDLLLENVRGKSFIPCFIEFTPKYCKFLVIRSKSALTAIHKLGFYIRHDDSEIGITLMHTDLTLNQIDFIPRLVLRKILSKRYDSEMQLDLKAFTLQEDISHFIYFPLNRPTNQAELTQLQSTVAWEYLTDLNLSHNRLKSIDSFSLESRCPRLRKLDLSHNCLERATSLLRCHDLPLRALRLEGNPLCHDYTDPDHYVKVVKMMFPGLTEIDGLPIRLKGDLPKPQRHYCPEDAKGLVEQFLEVFFPLLDSEEGGHVEDMYAEQAVMTVTYRTSARSYLYRHFRNLTLRARSLEEGEMEAVEGASSIAKLVSKWPPVEHDPATFTSDVLYHTDLSTILRVGGILKLTSDSLAQDEHLLAFTRTFVLTSRNGVEYKIQHEMVHWDEPTSQYAEKAFQINSVVHWDEPTSQYAEKAFQINSVKPKRLSLKFESPPDKETKDGLIDIFSKITELDKELSERCLEVKEWNLKNALEHFMKLVKLDCLDSLKKTDTPRD